MFDIRDYLTVPQVAEKLGYGYASITRLIRTGKLPAVKRGRQYFISPGDIEKYLLSFGNNPEQLS